MISHTPSRADYEQAYLHILSEGEKKDVQSNEKNILQPKETVMLTWNQAQRVFVNTNQNGDSHHQQHVQSQQRIPLQESH